MATAPQNMENDANGLSEKSQQDVTTNGNPEAPAKQEQDHQQHPDGTDVKEQKKDGPQGGYDSTPIPSPPSGTVGYTLKITIHQAINLAMGDAHAFSSDPYVLAQMNTDIPMRHKEDPKLRFRTPTVRKNTDPEWNEEWIVANVPSTGFKLKLRVYDEDPADHDDLLGKVHITVPSLDGDWRGIKRERYRLAVRDASKRALFIRTVANCLRFVEHMTGEMFVSIEMLGQTEGHEDQNGRPYTVGPCRWFRHYSPILGRLAGMREPDQNGPDKCGTTPKDQAQKKAERYNFQANEVQLPGPVPPELYHRFVEFKPWVRRMFTTSGFSGVVLGKALHHQHTRVYNFDRSTVWGHVPGGASVEMTKQFLDLVHYDQGGRIFTYVLTLDSLWRFTETGKEFGVDMLSKHTMHSDVSIYIAFSGEFFIRRLKHKHRPPPPQPAEETSQQDGPERDDNETHPPHDLDNGPPDDDPPKDPSYYQLVIDNDSGTYRPNAAMLPKLSAYLAQCLPGLHIQTLDCQADEKKMAKMKGEQRERKKKEGDHIIYAQVSDSSSISSSDDEALDDVQNAYQNDGTPSNRHGVSTGDGRGKERGTTEAVAKDLKRQQQARMEKMNRNFRGRERGESTNAATQGPKVLADGGDGP